MNFSSGINIRKGIKETSNIELRGGKTFCFQWTGLPLACSLLCSRRKEARTKKCTAHRFPLVESSHGCCLRVYGLTVNRRPLDDSASFIHASFFASQLADVRSSRLIKQSRSCTNAEPAEHPWSTLTRVALTTWLNEPYVSAQRHLTTIDIVCRPYNFFTRIRRPKKIC